MPQGPTPGYSLTAIQSALFLGNFPSRLKIYTTKPITDLQVNDYIYSDTPNWIQQNWSATNAWALYQSGSPVRRAIKFDATGKITEIGTFVNNEQWIDYDLEPSASPTNQQGFNGDVLSLVELDNGKILVGGDFGQYNGITMDRMCILNTDGTPSTPYFLTGFNNSVYSMDKQSDGKIVVGGRFTSYNVTTRNRVLRLNSDAFTVDTTFSTNLGTGFNGNVFKVKVDTSTGNIYVGGEYTSLNGVTRNRIVRLLPTGAVDTSFNIGTGFNGLVEDIEIQSDGKIVLVGGFTSYNGTACDRIIRLLSNGSVDTTFMSGFLNQSFNGGSYVVAIKQHPTTGKLLVGGQFTSFTQNGTTYNTNYFAILNIDGTIYSTPISANTAIFNNTVEEIEVLDDGSILVGGQFDGSYNTAPNYQGRLVRLNSDGTIAASQINGGSFNASVFMIKKLSNSRIVVGGSFTNAIRVGVWPHSSNRIKGFLAPGLTPLPGITYSSNAIDLPLGTIPVDSYMYGRIIHNGVDNTITVVNAPTTQYAFVVTLQIQPNSGFSSTVYSVKIYRNGSIVSQTAALIGDKNVSLGTFTNQGVYNFQLESSVGFSFRTRVRYQFYTMVSGTMVTNPFDDLYTSYSSYQTIS